MDMESVDIQVYTFGQGSIQDTVFGDIPQDIDLLGSKEDTE